MFAGERGFHGMGRGVDLAYSGRFALSPAVVLLSIEMK